MVARASAPAVLVDSGPGLRVSDDFLGLSHDPQSPAVAWSPRGVKAGEFARLNGGGGVTDEEVTYVFLSCTMRT